MASENGKGTKTVITIGFLISWVILVNIIVESEGNGLTNAEWLAGVVVTFGMLFLWAKVMNSV
jgi:cytosine/uracil/thiamine/allantoin permease